MRKLIITTAMGILTGLASESQAQSYLSKDSWSFSKDSTAISSRIDLKEEDFDLPARTFESEVSFLTRAGRMQDENIKANTATAVVGTSLTWNVTRWLKTDLVADYLFVSGHSQAIYGSEGSPGSALLLGEASASIMAGEVFQFTAGIIDTQFNPILSAYAGDTTAGFRETVNLKSGAFQATLHAFQAIPGQSGASNRLIDDNNEAFLSVNNLLLSYGEKNKIQASYTKFDFYNITSTSANESRYMGNSFFGDGTGANLFFQYKFRGQEAALATSLNFRLDDKLTWKGSMIENSKAPSKRNLGWMSSLSYEYNFSSYQIRPALLRYRFEPDIIPAAYSSASLGFLNRDGYSGELRGKFKRYNLDIFAKYMDAKEVEPRLTQSDRVTYSIGMEVTHEIL